VKTIATSVPPAVDNGDPVKLSGRQAVSILVVDDEESIRTYVERVLSKAGYRITLAASGPDAIGTAAGGSRFDLLLTDVMMPEMTGAELARRLRQGNPLLKVLYLTGYTDQLFTEKVTLWEDEAFLEKPCSPEALLQAVSLAVTGSTKG
jgi:two-component system cell cycle sensor histidine kinase/response regulator CckA